MSSSNPEPGPGSLLLAEPLLMEPHFKRSVVLICEHSDAGSFGLVLNKPLPIRLSEVTDALPGLDQPLFLGGPVQRDTLHVIHRHGGQVEGAVEVTDGVYWGGGIDDIRVLVQSGEAAADDFRLFLGYSGWGAGQLADEINRGGWIVIRGTGALVFQSEPDTLWRAILKQMGGAFAVMSNFPEDPRLN